MAPRDITPMIRQYLEIKGQHPDAILFFRLGDFYEMFFEDARVGSRELDIALTSRDKGQKDSIPLCGVPYFAAETYISKLLQKGYKVALCDQVEDAKQAKGIVLEKCHRLEKPIDFEKEVSAPAVNKRPPPFTLMPKRGGAMGKVKVVDLKDVPGERRDPPRTSWILVSPNQRPTCSCAHPVRWKTRITGDSGGMLFGSSSIESYVHVRPGAL
jgi:hypothetical protein